MLNQDGCSLPGLINTVPLKVIHRDLDGPEERNLGRI